MDQSIVCQNPFTWNMEHNWTIDPNNISIRLKSDKLSLADYYATKNTFSKLSIEAITDLILRQEFLKIFARNKRTFNR